MGIVTTQIEVEKKAGEIASATFSDGTMRSMLYERMVDAFGAKRAPHYPAGMGDESRRLHREYNRLVEAQRLGAKNGAEVIALTDECSAKGIILVPGGERL